MEDIIRLRCSFIELLDKLEKISIDFIDLTCFNDYIYMDPRNEYNYKISSVTNNIETYTFYYLKSNNNFEIIPNAIFIPDHYYDFEVDIKNKKFKKFDEYIQVTLNMLSSIKVLGNTTEIKHTIINMQIDEDKKNNDKSLFRKIFGC